MARALGALGIECVGDLLEHVPRDRLAMRLVRSLHAGEQATVAVQVAAIESRPLPANRSRKARSVVSATVSDASGSRRALFFNQPWLVRSYPPGTALLLHGKLDPRGHLQVWSHARDRHRAPARSIGAGPVAGPGALDDRVVGGDAPGVAVGRFPLYPATAGVSSTRLATLVRSVRPALADVPDPLPARLRARERLPGRASALAALHFAAADRLAERARERLAFEELLLAQLELLGRRARRRARPGPVIGSLDPASSHAARWLRAGLPFALTRDQRAAMRAIDADLGASSPMQRLLIGEVGSGKTVVALYAMLRAAEHGHQAALMAPTETLAMQHLATVAGPLRCDGVAVGLLTGSTTRARRRELLAELARGELQLLVGTHALLEPDVRFRSLALAVVDEQHRFGVRQRAALDRKGPSPAIPHVLHMSATPIPRTLALAIYGDLDVSTLRELPQGRQPVATRIVASAAGRARAYEALRGELRAGRQGYVVCPLVAPADEDAEDGAEPAWEGERALAPEDDRPRALAPEDDRRAATAELQRLATGELAGFRLRLLHGRMQPAEKQAAMAAFTAGEADVLVCTTVVEVGIDVPNATVMLIEDAERFGISQLHQLRGRVGRGAHAGQCFLLANAPRSRRLQALARHRDGFALAEIDLAVRGRGELTGTRQSGAERFRLARLPEDGALLERARTCALGIVACDHALRSPEHALLRDALARAFSGGAADPIPA